MPKAGWILKRGGTMRYVYFSTSSTVV
jgi:hypothetical protein